MLGHVVIKTMDSGLNPETSTSWLVTEVSLSPLISSEAWGKVKKDQGSCGALAC